MIGAWRMGLAVGGRLARTAVGFAVIGLLVAAMVPAPSPDVRARADGSGAVGNPMDRVAVTVPEGELVRHLTITNASGRTLATLTHWATGETMVVAHGDGGSLVSCWLNRQGRAILNLTGRLWRNHIEMNRDGAARTRVVQRVAPGPLKPPPADLLPGGGRITSGFPPFFLLPVCLFDEGGRCAGRGGPSGTRPTDGAPVADTPRPRGDGRARE